MLPKLFFSKIILFLISTLLTIPTILFADDKNYSALGEINYKISSASYNSNNSIYSKNYSYPTPTNTPNYSGIATNTNPSYNYNSIKDSYLNTSAANSPLATSAKIDNYNNYLVKTQPGISEYTMPVNTTIPVSTDSIKQTFGTIQDFSTPTIAITPPANNIDQTSLVTIAPEFNTTNTLSEVNLGNFLSPEFELETYDKRWDRENFMQALALTIERYGSTMRPGEEDFASRLYGVMNGITPYFGDFQTVLYDRSTGRIQQIVISSTGENASAEPSYVYLNPQYPQNRNDVNTALQQPHLEHSIPEITQAIVNRAYADVLSDSPRQTLQDDDRFMQALLVRIEALSGKKEGVDYKPSYTITIGGGRGIILNFNPLARSPVETPTNQKTTALPAKMVSTIEKIPTDYDKNSNEEFRTSIEPMEPVASLLYPDGTLIESFTNILNPTDPLNGLRITTPDGLQHTYIDDTILTENSAKNIVEERPQK